MSIPHGSGRDDNQKEGWIVKLIYELHVGNNIFRVLLKVCTWMCGSRLESNRSVEL